ncbi:23S rRNA m(1)G-748 methyltransferase [Raineyella antarctica]|uniref:23S rRNA m(1)G-748 methyltransferase n=1 Tax=Raineyella antarctica TaxID=1577474 RepID=A0A1G6HA18_9ACTN|nr:methyltransferase domain-containing protein [Raineyella antarctica]SDB90928.1 23S rRNA m(1)G-748 methyltransferase [Raineyella antarctica]
MLADVADLLTCPQCGSEAGSPLTLEGRTLHCPRGHSFDLARQGYVNLLTHAAPANADTADMVAARDRFLSSGAYAPIRDELARRVGTVRTVLEVGAGTGYYLAGCLGPATAAGGRGLALDISPAAARRAARAHPRIGAVVADTWAGLPVRSGSVDVLLAVFAPRNPAEFARVLAPQGRVLVALPLPDHLAELRAELGLLDIEADKESRLLAQFAGHLQPAGHVDVRFELTLSAPAAQDLVAMGPNAFHGRKRDSGADDVEAGPRTVTVAVRIRAFTRS